MQAEVDLLRPHAAIKSGSRQIVERWQCEAK
jgi:hypothetical protein